MEVRRWFQTEDKQLLVAAVRRPTGVIRVDAHLANCDGPLPAAVFTKGAFVFDNTYISRYKPFDDRRWHFRVLTYIAAESGCGRYVGNAKMDDYYLGEGVALIRNHIDARHAALGLCRELCNLVDYYLNLIQLS